MTFDIKKDKKTNKAIITLSTLGICNSKEKAILMQTPLMMFFKEFQKMDSDTVEFNYMMIISVTDDNKSTITNSDINGLQVVGGTNNDGSTASGKMPDWYDSLIDEALLIDGSTEYMEEVKGIIDQFVDDITNDFSK